MYLLFRGIIVCTGSNVKIFFDNMLGKEAAELGGGDVMSKPKTLTQQLLKELEEATKQIQVHQMQENPNFSEEDMLYIKHTHGEADPMDPQLGEKEEEKVVSNNDKES